MNRAVSFIKRLKSRHNVFTSRWYLPRINDQSVHHKMGKIERRFVSVFLCYLHALFCVNSIAYLVRLANTSNILRGLPATGILHVYRPTLLLKVFIRNCDWLRRGRIHKTLAELMYSNSKSCLTFKYRGSYVNWRRMSKKATIFFQKI